MEQVKRWRLLSVLLSSLRADVRSGDVNSYIDFHNAEKFGAHTAISGGAIIKPWRELPNISMNSAPKYSACPLGNPSPPPPILRPAMLRVLSTFDVCMKNNAYTSRDDWSVSISR